MEDLETRLRDWHDFDVAALEPGKCLGVFSPTAELHQVKWVLWSNNPVGNALYSALEALAGAGILDVDREEQRYRWNAGGGR